MLLVNTVPPYAFWYVSATALIKKVNNCPLEVIRVYCIRFLIDSIQVLYQIIQLLSIIGHLKSYGVWVCVDTVPFLGLQPWVCTDCCLQTTSYAPWSLAWAA